MDWLFTLLPIASVLSVVHAQELSKNSLQMRILELGFGIGADCRFLRATFPSASIEQVDVAPALPFVARHFFNHPQAHADPLTSITTADARAYTQSQTRHEEYDLIVQDTFTDKGQLPAHLADQGWFQLVRERLADGGLFALKFLAYDVNNVLPGLLQQVLPHFDQAW